MGTGGVLLKIRVDGVIYQIETMGGVSRHFNEILPRLCKIDPSLEIQLFTDGPLQQLPPEHERIYHLRSQNPSQIRTKNHSKRIFLPFTRLGDRIGEAIRGNRKAEIWHSTYYTLPKNWPGKQAATLHDTVHELYPDLYDSPFDDHLRLQKQQSIEAADMVICVSETISAEACDYFRVEKERLCVIHNACSDVFQRLDRDLLPDVEPYILYVGSRSPIKNFDRLLRAYASWPLRSEVSWSWRVRAGLARSVNG
jgi:mannosyltransferase